MTATIVRELDLDKLTQNFDREELRERPIYNEALKQLRGEWIASSLALVDQMILVGQDAA